MSWNNGMTVSYFQGIFEHCGCRIPGYPAFGPNTTKLYCDPFTQIKCLLERKEDLEAFRIWSLNRVREKELQN